MNWWKVILLLLAYAVVALMLLLGVLWVPRWSGSNEGATTLVAALGGALVASLGAIVTSMVGSLGKQRDTDERIRDEASRIALELTRLDYDLRQRALPERGVQEFLAPAKVYREFYKAIVELRTKGTWPNAIADQGLLDIFAMVRRKAGNGTE